MSTKVELMIERAADRETIEAARSALAELASTIHHEAPLGEASTWYDRIMDARIAIKEES